MKKHLLIINYSMDSTNPVFSHQIQVVRELSREFQKITVITGEAPRDPIPANIDVYISSWKPGKNIKNGFSFLKIFLKILVINPRFTVFSHMTEVQSALISPITKIFRIKHFLWYAHVSKSIYLSWNNFWVDGIITSTSGSCPVQGKKIHVIGQAIDKNLFAPRSHKLNNLQNLIHIGRFDESKNISELIQVTKEIRSQGKNLTLHIVGSPSNAENEIYQSKLIQANHLNTKTGWLTFSPSILRDKIRTTLTEYDIFLHAFQGSLDKTIVEATFVGLPVVTTNREYLSEFGGWVEGSTNLSLAAQLNALLNTPHNEIKSILEARYQVAIKSHSLVGWIKKLVKILNSEFDQ
jgi:glycosyltransferase involved in cell wall biosynthesis